ncbi:predicted protein [Lichtheimia corymbifera JMRC:FSU:9682]|uniref:Uncharacterized protein n=1 Tax=Lichtheimia corymbifera JMRC:FSU:9682 TaxID=1263082 RepID=A0A068S0C7_9FUNG|nr:predicted protein [Lichtheimia corymbifera JMRC:FSU:9682]
MSTPLLSLSLLSLCVALGVRIDRCKEGWFAKRMLLPYLLGNKSPLQVRFELIINIVNGGLATLKSTYDNEVDLATVGWEESSLASPLVSAGDNLCPKYRM